MKRRRKFSNLRGACHLLDAPLVGTYESKLERCALVHWLLEPDVATVRLGSPRIAYIEDGKKHRYTADLEVGFMPGVKRRPLAIECKYRSMLDADSELTRKLAIVADALATLGWDFRIETDTEVFGPELANKTFVLGHRNDPPSSSAGRLLRMVRRYGVISLGDLLAECSPSEAEQLALVPALWRLVAHKELFVDYSKPMSRSALICSTPLYREGGWQ